MHSQQRLLGADFLSTCRKIAAYSKNRPGGGTRTLFIVEVQYGVLRVNFTTEEGINCGISVLSWRKGQRNLVNARKALWDSKLSVVFLWMHYLEVH